MRACMHVHVRAHACADRFRTLDPACPVENLLRPVFDFTRPAPPDKGIKVLYLSDSLGEGSGFMGVGFGDFGLPVRILGGASGFGV